MGVTLEIERTGRKHRSGRCPAPVGDSKRSLACNGWVRVHNGDMFVCALCGQVSTVTEVLGMEPWKGEL